MRKILHKISRLRHVRSQKLLSISIIALSLVVAGGVVLSHTSQSQSIIALAPEQIGEGQGVAACYSSSGVTCNPDRSLHFEITFEAHCSSYGDSSLNIGLINDSTGTNVQTRNGTCDSKQVFDWWGTAGQQYSIQSYGNVSGHLYGASVFSAPNCTPPPTPTPNSPPDLIGDWAAVWGYTPGSGVTTYKVPFQVAGSGGNWGGTDSGAYYSQIQFIDLGQATPFAATGGILIGNSAPGTWTATPVTTYDAANYPLPVGNHQMRICTDVTGGVAESNENNNCGPWSWMSVVCPSGQVKSGVGCVPQTWTTYCTGTGNATPAYNWTYWQYDNSTPTQYRATSLPQDMNCAPPPPTNQTGVCSANGTQGTISWTAPSGYNTFYTRVTANGAYVYPGTDENFVGTTKTFATTPGQAYAWWVHTKDTGSGWYSSSVGGSFTCTPAPPAPTNVSAQCHADGKHFNLNWTAAPGASTYYPRVHPVSQSVCSSVGWSWLPDSGGICYTDNRPNGTSVSTFPITPGATYNAWVHSGNPVNYAAAGSTSFSCPANNPPVGNFDVASCSTLAGWAYDPDSSSSSITVHIYEGSTYIAAATANVARSDVNTAYGITGDHGFSISTPESLKTGAPRTLTVYALDSAGGTSPVVGSAKTITCAAGQPNLTAGLVTPTSAVVGTPQTFSATVSNIGSGTTGASFSNFFQVASTVGGGGTITDLAATTMSTLTAGASGTASKSYTFPTAGTYSMRACADKSSSGNAGTITESNEGDNCGAWQNVTATAGSVSVAFAGNGCVLPVGGGSCNITSHWTVTGLPVGETVDLAAVGPGIALNYQKLPVATSREVAQSTIAAVYGALLPTTRSNASPFPVPVFQPGQFTLTLLQHSTGAALGNALALVACPAGYTIAIVGGVETCIAPITPTAVTILTPTDPRVRVGQSTTITWSAQNVTSCTLRNPGGVIGSATATGGTISTQTTGSQAITGSTVFTLTCLDLTGGSVTRSVTVGILPIFNEN